MTPQEQQQAQLQTRDRLLEAASEVFAEQGLRSATVRKICRRAGANVAAINYHFGDKQQLYNAVLEQAFFSLAGEDPTDLGVDDAASAHERLHAFVRSLLMQLLSEGRAATYAKLVAREMVDPTDAINRVIEEGMRPQIELLLDLVRDQLRPNADDQQVRRCASSILGQCLFYYFARHVILQIPLEEHLQPENVEAIAAHITTMSLAALDQLARETHARGAGSIERGAIGGSLRFPGTTK